MGQWWDLHVIASRVGSLFVFSSVFSHLQRLQKNSNFIMPLPLRPVTNTLSLHVTRQFGPHILIPEGAAPDSDSHVFSVPLAKLDEWKAEQFHKLIGGSSASMGISRGRHRWL
jgi:hypothetical protein